MYSNLTISELGPPVSESSTGSQNFMPVVANRATQDTFLSLKGIRIFNFHLPFFDIFET